MTFTRSILARHVDLTPYQDACVAVRVRGPFPGEANHGALSVDILPDSPTTDPTVEPDPVDASLLVGPLVISATADLQVAPLRIPYSGLVRIILEGPRDSVTTAQVSIDLYEGRARPTRRRVKQETAR